MARVKRGVAGHAKHKKVLDQAKGYYGRRKNTIRAAKAAVEKAGQYAFRDRKRKKRTFRALWIQRINAAVRPFGMTYSVFINGLARSGIASVRALKAGGARIHAWDDKESARIAAEAEGAMVLPWRDWPWTKLKALVLSPGVPLTHPEPHWTVKKARAAGVEIVGDIGRWFANTVCDPRGGACPAGSVFALPVELGSGGQNVYHFGSLGRNVIIGPSFNNVDFSVIKNTNLTEEVRVQFRAEFFDLFNHANLGQPGRTAQVGSGTFGLITNTRFPTGDSGSSRQIQFALKLLF